MREEVGAVEIKISYLGPLRQIMNCREESLRLDPPVTVRTLLDSLIRAHGAHLREVFYTTQGWLDPRILFLIDGQRPEAREGLDTPLSGREEIKILMGLPLRGG